MSPQEVEEDLSEGDLLFFARHHVGDIILVTPTEFLSPSSRRLVVLGPVIMSSPA